MKEVRLHTTEAALHHTEEAVHQTSAVLHPEDTAEVHTRQEAAQVTAEAAHQEDIEDNYQTVQTHEKDSIDNSHDSDCSRMRPCADSIRCMDVQREQL